jgi:hypothetical protein
MPHVILFTGHMIDKPDRPSPRFPALKEAAAAEAIRNAVHAVQAAAAPGAGSVRGIAAGANGGDILFHEACLALGIPSELYLGIPVDAFEQTSVAAGGPDWIARYRRLTEQLPVHVLIPDATADVEADVWEDANDWMLRTALAASGADTTLIALWDGKKGDGVGGTDHLVRVVKEHHGKVVIIDVLAL